MTADGVRMLAVYFEAGARTLPHVHVNDQILHCIDGEGVVAVPTDERETSDLVRIRASDTVRVPGNTWHWHGATHSSPMTHLSVLVHDDRDRWDGVEKKDWKTHRE